jgi:hypothetical protein
MWLAHHFPGLALDVDAVWHHTPEQTDAMRRAGRELLEAEAEERLAHTKVIARAAGMRM